MLTVYDKNGSTTSDNLLSAKLAILVNPTSEELTNIEKTIGCDAHVFTKQTSATEVSHFNISATNLSSTKKSSTYFRRSKGNC